MKLLLKKYGLVLFLGALLLTYHGVNLWHREAYHSPFQAYAQLDFVSKQLATVGSFARYLTGQRRFDMLHGPSEPIQQLFLREELPFEFKQSPQLVEKGYLNQLRPFADALDRAGVHLVIVPVPTKLSFFRQSLPKTIPNFSAFHPIAADRGEEDTDSAYLQLVRRDPHHFVDLLSVFRRENSVHPQVELFVPYDSNWTSRGMVLAAEAVIEKLQYQIAGVVPVSRQWEGGFAPAYNDGLVHGLQLPDWYLRRHASFQWYEPRWTLRPANTKSARRIFLAGTCYGARLKGTRFGLGEMLAASQGMELHSFAVAGSHGTGALKGLWESGEKLRRGDILVLEFAFRQPWSAGEELKVPKLEPGDEPPRL